MGTILLRLGNANRLPLDDRVDVHVVSTSTNATVSVVRGVPGTAPLKFERLIERQTYLVKVFPKRHRPIAQFVTAGSDEQPATLQMYAPLHPDHVRAATFPEYPAVHEDLRRVLESSSIEGVQGKGAAVYGALGQTQKAGLFNLFAKMIALALEADLQASGAAEGGPQIDRAGVEADLSASALLRRDLAEARVAREGGQAGPLRRTVWSFVDKVFGVRGDRIFVDVQPALLDFVRAAADAEQFRAVSGSLHDPPAGFEHAGSFKSGERYGNLQLTFFSSQQTPRVFKVDADIDDAAGLGHTFQVLRNFVTQGTTHPYDIHQILVFRQETRLPYDLA